MDYKLIEYPDKEPVCLVEIFSQAELQKDMQFEFRGRMYKILEIKYFAKLVDLDGKGNRVYPIQPETGPDSWRLWPVPEIVVTQLPKY